MAKLALALALGLGLGAGCSTHGEDCPEGEPAIVSFAAEQQTTAAGADLGMLVEVANFQLTGHEHDEGGGHSHEGDCPGGHVHVYMDDLMTNPIGMPVTESFTVTIPDDAEPGEHTLIGRLHHRDHVILEPQVTAETTITVESP